MRIPYVRVPTASATGRGARLRLQHLATAVAVLLGSAVQAAPMVQAVANSGAASPIEPHTVTVNGVSGPVTATNGPATAETSRRRIDLWVDGSHAEWSPDSLSAFGQNESHYSLIDLDTQSLLDPLVAAGLNLTFQFHLQGHYENGTPFGDIMTNSYIDVGLTPHLQAAQSFFTNYAAVCSGSCALDGDGDYRMVPSNPPTDGDVDFGFELLHTGANQGSFYMAMNAMASAGDLVSYSLELTGLRFDNRSAPRVGVFLDDGTPLYLPSVQVPEPGSLALLGCALIGLLATSRRR